MFFKTLKEKMKFKTLKQVLFEDLQRNKKGLISQLGCFHNEVGFKRQKEILCDLRHCKLSKI